MMSMVSFGDLAQNFMLRAHTSRMKGQVATLLDEMASNRKADIGAALRGDQTQLSALAHSRTITAGYQSAANEAAHRLSSMQSLIEGIASNAESLTPELLSAPLTGKVALLADEATARLESVIGAMNTVSGGRSLLSGIDSIGPAITTAASILTALRQELAGAGTVDEILQRATDWFDNPAGFEAIAYLGAEEEPALAISVNDRVWVGPTASDPAFRAAILGFALAAIAADLPENQPDSQRRILAQKAGEALITGQNALTELAARIGISEERTDAARARNAAELLTLEMAHADLVGNDPYRGAIELEAVQTNLEALHTITARLSRLSLVDLMR